MNDIIIPELEELVKVFKPLHKPWTDEEVAIVIKYYPIMDTKKLSLYLGRSLVSVYNKSRALGLSK